MCFRFVCVPSLDRSSLSFIFNYSRAETNSNDLCFLCPSSLQASLWFASWCCCLSTSPGLRSALRGWAWCTSWPACRPSWAPCSTTSSWTTREGSPSTTPSSNSTCVESAWSTLWVNRLLGSSADFFTVYHFGFSRPSVIAGLFTLRVEFFFLYWLSMIYRGSVLLGGEPVLICQNKFDYWVNWPTQTRLQVLKWLLICPCCLQPIITWQVQYFAFIYVLLMNNLDWPWW